MPSRRATRPALSWRLLVLIMGLALLAAGCPGDTESAEEAPEGAGLEPPEGVDQDEIGHDAPPPNGGDDLYAQYCVACHQSDGQGIEGAYPALAGNPVVTADDPSAVIGVVLRGRGGMPTFSNLEDETLAELVSYIRQAWENDAAAVDPAAVAAAREAEEEGAEEEGAEEEGEEEEGEEQDGEEEPREEAEEEAEENGDGEDGQE